MSKFKQIKIEPNKRAIFEEFKKLGWSFIHHGVGHYNFVKPNGKETNFTIYFPFDGERVSRVESEFGNFHGAMCFFFPYCDFYWIDDDCISLTARGVKKKSVFINFSNYRGKDVG